jgi:DNA-binding beta-propeller fold protein YncE
MVFGSLSLQRMNRVVGLSIVPLMLLSIAVFSRFAKDPTPAEPPTEGTLVVANLRRESLTFIDLAKDERAELVLPGPPHELLVAEGRLYVTLGRGNLIVEVDTVARAVLRTLPLEGEPHGLAFLGGNLYVTLDKANEAVVIDRASLTELRRLPTGNTPHVIAATGGAILVTDSRDNVLRQLEPSPGQVATGGQPEGLAIVGGVAVTADAGGGTVTFARVPGLGEPRTLRIGAAPVRVTPLDASRVLVSLQGDDRVAVVDAVRGEVTKRLAVGARPDGACVSPGGDYVAVASNAAGAVDFYETAKWRRAPALSLEPGLGACAWLPAR